MRWFGASVLLLVSMGSATAGPIVIGGDDLTEHGSRTGAGVNLDGWLYIEHAIAALQGSVTRGGPFTVDIAALGSAGTGVSYPDGNAGAAIGSVADVLGLSVTFYDGATAISSFFSALAAGTVNPRVIWLAGDEATNDLDATEGSVLTARAGALNGFVASGGGLLAHGAADAVAQGWLTALLPGMVLSPSCTVAPGGVLTAAGQALLTGVTEADINAGACHGSYGGDLGGLVPLALDADGLPFLIGGNAAGGSITDGSAVPEPGSCLLLGTGLLLARVWRLMRG